MENTRPYGVTVVSFRTILPTKCRLQGRDLKWNGPPFNDLV